MPANFKFSETLKFLPLLFHIFGLACSLMFVVAAFALFTNLFREARIFFYIGLTGILVLSLVILGTTNRDLKETGVSQLFSLILSFLFLPLFLAFPTWIIFPNINWFDAYLDMVSAFTTTGFPVLEKENLSPPVHLWRALVAWFGGGLIWIAAFVILLPVNFGGLEIFSNEKNSKNSNRKLTLDERSSTLIKVSKKLIPIYLGLTVALWGCLTSFGTDGYTSLIRALSVVSTSGISGPEKFELDGAGFKGELIIVFFLLLAISNNIIKIFYKQFSLKGIFSDKEIRLGLFITLSATILFTLKQMSVGDLYTGLGGSFGNLFGIIWGNFFTVFSFITTNGYVSAFWDRSLVSVDLSYTVIILMGLSLFGGGVATTAGGIKLLRIAILFSAFSNETGKLLHPSSVAVKNNYFKDIKMSVFMAWIFFMLFMVSTAILTIILTVFESRFEDAIVLAVACLTTTGPIIEIVELENFLIIDLPIFSKIALIIGMVLGRLEILVALSLITFGLNRD